MTHKEILDLPMEGEDSFTIRDFLKECLCRLIIEGESFSGKRPLGNSDWDHNLAMTLIQAGAMKGQYNEEYDEYDFKSDDLEKVLLDAIVEEM